MNDEHPLLAKLGLVTANIKGDGNCLFRSLADQLWGEEGRHAEARAAVVEHLNTHATQFRLFIDENERWERYVGRMSRDGVYGDNVEIVAFAQHFHVNV